MKILRYSGRCVRLPGFTLIELMVVIVILGLLATIIMPKILDRPEQARRLKKVSGWQVTWVRFV